MNQIWKPDLEIIVETKHLSLIYCDLEVSNNRKDLGRKSSY